ncbi:family 1 glycosyltransferase [Cryphonectria parasitica EP155]|uniref:UDP-N-acetylglucosamine transferase subunit ALG13 n=1 Tax=Cryphonectria parasitica (strain ATCC 38755 / EP155) TaxID=660469 RepID=A0A9P5CIM8_CRYP1|nr:family 1 glycosyltransferase [Cryphonectria parasitica EP155]KAF3760819.1 family 1 glycosyltransferase [Cryphonectria parasitica EP155]
MDRVEDGRVALVTGGATVVFKELIDETLAADFLNALQRSGFSTLLLQCGTYHGEVLQKLVNTKHENLTINAFDFDSNLKEQMKKCRGEANVQPAGIVISHAGTGTIADCAEVQVAQIIVANPNLMDNHQAEFAKAMARNHATIIQGHLGSLAQAIPEALEAIKTTGLDLLDSYREPAFPVREDDRLTFLDQVIAVDL